MSGFRARIIFHVDLDSFYPSVETRESPKLKGLPVIVGADPKGGKGRGVVVSASYEARRVGVHAGQPISLAYRLCPQGVYLRPRLPFYAKASRRVMDLLRSHADQFEQVSIDEAFLDATEKAGSYEAAQELAVRIKADVSLREGLTVSIGIAPNKSAAKIASDLHKPDGLTIVEPSRVKEFLAPLPVSVITGVGKKSERVLKSLGIETIGQLQSVPGKELVKHFGKGGVWLWGVAHGLEQLEVRERTSVKSLSVEHTFEEDVGDRVVVHAKMSELAAELHRRIVAANVTFRTVGIRVRFTGFETFLRQRSLASPTDERGVLLHEAQTLFQEFERGDRKIRLIGVRVSELRGVELQPSRLDAWISQKR